MLALNAVYVFYNLSCLVWPRQDPKAKAKAKEFSSVGATSFTRAHALGRGCRRNLEKGENLIEGNKVMEGYILTPLPIAFNYSPR